VISGSGTPAGAGRSGTPATAGRRGRRPGPAPAVLLGAAGAALALLGATRTWAVVETARPEPLPVDRETPTGRELAPLVPALAFVGLAASVGLVAARRAGRRVVAVLLLLAGAGTAAAAVAGAAAVGPPTGAATAALRPAWPALAALGGVLLAVAGLLALVRGRRWAALGARYEAPAGGPGGQGGGQGGGPGAPSPAGARGGAGDAGLWDALDRGEDPTAPDPPADLRS